MNVQPIKYDKDLGLYTDEMVNKALYEITGRWPDDHFLGLENKKKKQLKKLLENIHGGSWRNKWHKLKDKYGGGTIRKWLRDLRKEEKLALETGLAGETKKFNWKSSPFSDADVKKYFKVDLAAQKKKEKEEEEKKKKEQENLFNTAMNAGSTSPEMGQSTKLIIIVIIAIIAYFLIFK